MTKQEFAELKFEDKLAEQLLTKHGPLMYGSDLWRTLGYSSAEAFRKARAQNRLEISVFPYLIGAEHSRLHVMSLTGSKI